MSLLAVGFSRIYGATGHWNCPGLKSAAAGGSFDRSRSSSCEPLLKRQLTFPGGPSGEQSCDADILVQVLPMDSSPPANQPPVFALLGRGMQQSGVPVQGNREGPAIAQFHIQRVRPYRYVLGMGDCDLNRGSTHPKPPSVPCGVLLPGSESERSLRGRIPRCLAIGPDSARTLRFCPLAQHAHGAAHRGQRRKRKSGTAPPATPSALFHYN